MTHKIYVGNLPYRATEADLETLFSECGEVIDINIIYDRATKRSKGFGFIEFESETAMTNALQKNGESLQGRTIKVSHARDKAKQDENA